VRNEAKNVFRTHKPAEEFAFGLEVMMKLRGCRGAKRFVEGEKNWHIGLWNGKLGVYETRNTPTDCILGRFDTKENAQAAIAIVGEGTILRAIAGLV
jgi:hypothetical protein